MAADGECAAKKADDAADVCSGAGEYRIHNCDQRSPVVEFVHPALKCPVRLEQRGAKSAGWVSGTSSVAWPMAAVTSRHLCHHPELVRARKVVELGAGLGLCGAVSAALGAELVVLTDWEGAIPLLEANRDRLREDGVADCVSVARISWGEADDVTALLGRDQRLRDGFDVIVSSDVLIAGFNTKELLESGLALLSRHPDACWLMGFELREEWETVGNWIMGAEEAGMVCTHAPLRPDGELGDADDSDDDSGMYFYTLRWKKPEGSV